MKKPLFVLIVVLLLLTAVAWTVYMKSTTQNPQAASEMQAEDLVKKIGDLIVLPKDEVPTIATVSDKTRLKGQAFFNNAQNGDKLLIYTKAKKAILYRPSINKIIEVGPVNIGPTKTSPAPTKIKIIPTEKLVPSLSPTVVSPSAEPTSN